MKKHLKRLAQSKTVTRVILPIALVIILALIGFMSFRKPAEEGVAKDNGGIFKSKNLKMDEAKTAAENFINEFLMSGGTNKATVKEITEEYGLYKLQVDIVSDVVESYMTKDGRLFFPQAFDTKEMAAQQAGAGAGAQATPKTPTDLPKSDKPIVELFVMSHCPYGTQIEKGIIPAVEALGKKIDFQLKFVDYAMHGEVELKEQLNQYCINKNQPEKLNTYLKCFLVEGKGDECLASTGINTSKLESCVKSTDNEYKITENFKNKVGFKGSYPGFDIYKDDNAKYGVAGSPTLVINGEQAETGRDAASLLSAICAAFNNQPAECKTTLSSDTPAPGFGTGTQAAGSAAAACN